MEVVTIKNFSISTRNGEKFIEALEDLCGKHAVSGEYYFKFDVE